MKMWQFCRICNELSCICDFGSPFDRPAIGFRREEDSHEEDSHTFTRKNQ